MRTQQEDKKQEQVLPETEFAGTWVLDFQPEESWEVNVSIDKPPTLCYFVSAAGVH